MKSGNPMPINHGELTDWIRLQCIPVRRGNLSLFAILMHSRHGWLTAKHIESKERRRTQKPTKVLIAKFIPMHFVFPSIRLRSSPMGMGTKLVLRLGFRAGAGAGWVYTLCGMPIRPAGWPRMGCVISCQASVRPLAPQPKAKTCHPGASSLSTCWPDHYRDVPAANFYAKRGILFIRNQPNQRHAMFQIKRIVLFICAVTSQYASNQIKFKTITSRNVLQQPRCHTD